MKRIWSICLVLFCFAGSRAFGQATFTFVNNSATPLYQDSTHYPTITDNGSVTFQNSALNPAWLIPAWGTVGPVGGWGGYSVGSSIVFAAWYKNNNGSLTPVSSPAQILGSGQTATFTLTYTDTTSNQPTNQVVTVTIGNPPGSGQIGYANFVFDGLPYAQYMLCPGLSATLSKTCSTVDPVDTFTGSFVATGSSTTNVSGTVLNNLPDKVVNAYWKFNGNLVKSEYLMPGQSDSYTFNFDNCAGGNPSFTWGYTVVGTSPDSTNPNAFGTLTNSLGSYTASNPTNGSFVPGGGFTGGSPNGFGSTYDFTNNINYATGLSNLTGLALDSTLRSGVGQLHDDNLNVIKGEGVLHQDNGSLLTGLQALQSLAHTNPINLYAPSNVFVMNFPSNPPSADYTGVLTNSLFETKTFHGDTTNLLGQMVSYEGIISNDLYLITKWATNQVPLTNQFTVQFPTNGTFVFSNQPFMLTNYATESTLQGISNLLAVTDGSFSNLPSFSSLPDMSTNILSDGAITGVLSQFSYGFSGVTNYDQAVTTSSGYGLATSETTLSTFASGFVDFSALMNDTYPKVPMTYTFALGGSALRLAKSFGMKASSTTGTGATIDFDPLDYVSDAGDMPFVALFDVAKKFFAWGIILIYFRRVLDDAYKAVMIMNGAHGVTPTAVSAEIKKMS